MSGGLNGPVFAGLVNWPFWPSMVCVRFWRGGRQELAGGGGGGGGGGGWHCCWEFGGYKHSLLGWLGVKVYMFFAARTKVLGWLRTGKYSIVFSSRCALMLEACLRNCGQLPLSELVCLDEVLQETQCRSLG